MANRNRSEAFIELTPTGLKFGVFEIPSEHLVAIVAILALVAVVAITR